MHHLFQRLCLLHLLCVSPSRHLRVAYANADANTCGRTCLTSSGVRLNKRVRLSDGRAPEAQERFEREDI